MKFVLTLKDYHYYTIVKTADQKIIIIIIQCQGYWSLYLRPVPLWELPPPPIGWPLQRSLRLLHIQSLTGGSPSVLYPQMLTKSFSSHPVPLFTHSSKPQFTPFSVTPLLKLLTVYFLHPILTHTCIHTLPPLITLSSVPINCLPYEAEHKLLKGFF